MTKHDKVAPTAATDAAPDSPETPSSYTFDQLRLETEHPFRLVDELSKVLLEFANPDIPRSEFEHFDLETDFCTAAAKSRRFAPVSGFRFDRLDQLMRRIDKAVRVFEAASPALDPARGNRPRTEDEQQAVIALRDQCASNKLLDAADYTAIAWEKYRDHERGVDRGTLPSASAKMPRPPVPGRKGKVKGKDINGQMLKVIAGNLESIGWSTRKWARHLDCSPSTISGSKTWNEELAGARAIAIEAAIARRTECDGTCRSARRKARHKSDA